MAKARSRAAARKVKDKWKAKKWYTIQAPPLFDNAPVAETLSESPDLLIGRVTEVSLQNLTNDFRKSHIKLFFKIHNIEDTTAHTQIAGHTLTNDYVRRMIRRRRSRIDGVYDISTRDGAILRVKPFATTERRIQSSQKKMIREKMKHTIMDAGQHKTLNEFIRDSLEGKIGSDIYKSCKSLYPVKRVEIYKTEIRQQPTVYIEDKKPETKKEEPKDSPTEPEIKKSKKKKEPKEPKGEITSDEQTVELKEESPTLEKEEVSSEKQKLPSEQPPEEEPPTTPDEKEPELAKELMGKPKTKPSETVTKPKKKPVAKKTAKKSKTTSKTPKKKTTKKE